MVRYQTLMVLLPSMLAHGFSPYFYMDFTDMTYANAVIYCQNKNMELVTIKNTEVNGMVSEYLQDRGVTDRVWISLACPSLVCSWPDGQPLSWSSWLDVDEPRDECVVIEDIPNGRWRGRRCDDVYLPLCYGLSTTVGITEAGLPTSDISTSNNGNGFTSEANTTEAAISTFDNIPDGFTSEASTTEAIISTTNIAEGLTSAGSTTEEAISTFELSTSNIADGFTSAASITDIVTSTFESGGDFIQQVFTVDSINSLPVTQPYVHHNVRSRLECAGKCLRSKPGCTAFVYNDQYCNLYNDYSKMVVIGSHGSIIWY